MAYGLPAIGEPDDWGQKVNDSIEAVKSTADSALALAQAASAPVTSVNGLAGDVVLDAAAVNAKPDTYVPDYSELTGKPATFPPTTGTTFDTAKAGNWLPAVADVTGLQAELDAKADDTAVVKTSGDQTVAGVKTFSSAPSVPDASFTIAKTSGLQTTLNAKQDAASLNASVASYLSTNSFAPIYYVTAGDTIPAGAPDGALIVVVPASTTPILTVLDEGHSTVDGTTISTASVTPAAGSLVLVQITSATTTGTATYPSSVTWAGGTLATVVSNAPGTANIAARLYSAEASGTAGAMTFTFPSTQESFAWRVVEITNVSTTIVQSAGLATTLTNPSVTLAGALSTNITLGFYSILSSGSTETEGSGYTALGTRQSDSNQTVSILAEYRYDGSSVVNYTSSSSNNKVLQAVEVAPV